MFWLSFILAAFVAMMLIAFIGGVPASRADARGWRIITWRYRGWEGYAGWRHAGEMGLAFRRSDKS